MFAYPTWPQTGQVPSKSCKVHTQGLERGRWAALWEGVHAAPGAPPARWHADLRENADRCAGSTVPQKKKSQTLPTGK